VFIDASYKHLKLVKRRRGRHKMGKTDVSARYDNAI